MKLGNPKQILPLGIVATLVLGFLAKTIFSTMGTGADAAKNSPNHRLENSSPAPDIGAVRTLEGAAQVQEKRATDVGSLDREIQSGFIQRDVFRTPAKTPKIDKNSGQTVASNALDSPRSTSASTRHDSGDALPYPQGVLPGTVGTAYKPEDFSESSDEKGDAPKKKATRVMRYTGFVDVGSPTAIIEIAGVSYNTSAGDRPIPELLIVSITKEKISVVTHGRSIAIPIGRQREL